jgi:hypothetical protein
MLNDIVLLIVGGIGGVIGKRAMTSKQQPQPPMGQCIGQPMGGYPTPGYSNNHGFNAMPTWTNPELDESWTPGPPPTTPPDHLEDDHEREQLAIARRESE